MLRISCLLVLAACAASAPDAEYPAPLPQDQEAVATVLDGMHEAAASADEEAYFGCYSEDSIFMGTDAMERWTKAEFQTFAHPFFARGEAWAFHATRRAIMFNEAGDLAWFDEDLATDALGPARGSGVLRRTRDGRWEVVHYNLALTIPNERFAEVHALLKQEADAPEADAPEAGAPQAHAPEADAQGETSQTISDGANEESN